VTTPNTTAVATDSPSFFTPQRTRLLAIVGGVVVLVALVIWFLVTASHRKEAFAAQALESARATAESGDIGQAVQQFEQVATTYAGTDAGYEANLGIAQVRLIAGQSELAISSLEDFLAANPPARFASPGNGLLGTGLENTGKYPEAAAAYRRASDLATIPYLKATLLLDVGRAQRLAGDTAAAIATYQQVIDTYGETAARSEAEVRLTELTSASTTG
jgi:TolA-binding protein